jgi:hypothetical protein
VVRPGAGEEVIAHNTPGPLAREIVRALPIRQGQSILEGHVGNGAFPTALSQVYPNHRLLVEVGDLNPHNGGLRPPLEVAQRFGSFRAYPGVDFLEVNPWRPPDWILGNPPYGDEATRDEAEPHVRRALEVVRPGGSVVFLLQAGFLFGSGRYDRMWRPGSGIPRPFHVWNVVGRPSFNVTGKPPPEPEGEPPAKKKKKGGSNRYEYVAIWWNTAVPEPKTTTDWLVDPAWAAANGRPGRRYRAWSGA